MTALTQPIIIDYVNESSNNEFHFPLSVFKRPSSQDEYNSLEATLDDLIDEVRDDENHPLAIVMQVIGDNLESFDNSYHEKIGKNVSNVDLVRYLMKENGLRQQDMAGIFASQGNVSKFLKGERSLSKNQMTKLIERFNLSADVFFL